MIEIPGYRNAGLRLARMARRRPHPSTHRLHTSRTVVRAAPPICSAARDISWLPVGRLLAYCATVNIWLTDDRALSDSIRGATP